MTASYKVLVVPKNLLLEAETSARTMATFAVQIEAVSTAAEALAKAESWLPDLVLFEAELLETAASDFCASFRSSPELRATKLLMISRQVGMSMGGESDHVEADGHLIPPVDKAQLVTTMAALIGVRRAHEISVELEALATIQGPEMAKPILSTTIELGESRMRVEAQDYLDVGTRVTARVHLPGEPEAVSIYATVQCVINELQLRYEIAFLKMDSEHEARLMEFLKRQEGTG